LKNQQYHYQININQYQSTSIKMETYFESKCTMIIKHDDIHRLNRLLNKQSTPINDITIDGKPLLLIAALNSSIECVKYLVPKVDINKPDGANQSALYLACLTYKQCNYDEQSERIKQYHYTNQRTKAILSDVPEQRARCLVVIKLLIANGADCNMKTLNGFTCLMVWCAPTCSGFDDKIDEQTRIEIVKLLLDAGASKIIATKYGHTPATLASHRHLLELAKFINDYASIEVESKGVHFD